MELFQLGQLIPSISIPESRFIGTQDFASSSHRYTRPSHAELAVSTTSIFHARRQFFIFFAHSMTTKGSLVESNHQDYPFCIGQQT
jgi:hypothetical protein